MAVEYEEALRQQLLLYSRGQYLSIRQEEDSLKFYGIPCSEEECKKEIQENIKSKPKFPIRLVWSKP